MFRRKACTSTAIFPGSSQSTDPPPGIWKGLDAKKNVCFLADMGIQFQATYKDKSTKKDATAVFNFTATDLGTGQSTDCSSGDSAKITFGTKSHSLELQMSKAAGEYSLTAATLTIIVQDHTFPGSTDNKKTVKASASSLNLMKTTLNNSYSCMLETQISLTKEDEGKDKTDLKNIFLRFTQVKRLEAFLQSTNFSEAVQPCFHDKKAMAAKGDWNVQNKTTKHSCLRVMSTMTLDVSYVDISGETNHAMIPVNGTATAGSGSCSAAKTTLKLSVEKNNLTLTFTTTKKSLRSKSGDMYQLDQVDFTYSPDSKYFPNHPATGPMQISGSNMSSHPVAVGYSYRCDRSEMLKVSSTGENTLQINLETTRWESFGIGQNGTFNKPVFCANENVTTPAPSTTPSPFDPEQPTQFMWKAEDSKNSTCFLALAGIQFHVNFKQTSGDDLQPTRFDFDNTTKVSTDGDCNNQSFSAVFTNAARRQTLKLTFMNDKKDFYLTDVMLQFVTLNTTFPNASNPNVTVQATASGQKLMRTPLNNTYSCTVESQVGLKSNDSAMTGVYLRLTEIKNLQAFLPGKDFSKQQKKCYSDQPIITATIGKWTILNSKGKACLKVDSAISLSMKYHDIAQKLQVANIPIDAKQAKASGSCKVNASTFMLDVDGTGMVNLSMTYISKKSSSASKQNDIYVLDNVTMTFDNAAKYFPNYNAALDTNTKIQGSSLDLYTTALNMSFRCDLPLFNTIQNATSNSSGLSVTFDKTRWEAFSVKDNVTFNEAQYCAGEATTLAPVTTQPTPPPYVPGDPTTANISVKDAKDNKTVCFKAEIGLQFRTTYTPTNGSKMEIGFNFNKGDTTYTASCSGQTSSVTFTNKKSQTITLTFTRDTKSNTTFLSTVTAKYEVNSNYFPGINSTVKTPVSGSMNVTEMTVPLNRSYKCEEHETDILLDQDKNFLVRITGVRLQAFDIKDGKYSAVETCMSDKPVPAANVGNWTVMDANKTACARYMFSATVKLNYTTLIGKRASVMIPIDNNTMAEGICNFDNTTSFFSLAMDNGKIQFFFFFNKTSSGKDFDSYMYDVHVKYNPTSMYFPNHDLTDESVELHNSSLKLFRTDQSHSYKCSSDEMTGLGYKADSVSLANITFSDVQVQPFGIEKNKNGVFSAADNCKSDTDLSPVVPIIVGSVLAVLIVIVVVAYFIGRSRSKQTSYETI